MPCRLASVRKLEAPPAEGCDALASVIAAAIARADRTKRPKRNIRAVPVPRGAARDSPPAPPKRQTDSPASPLRRIGGRPAVEVNSDETDDMHPTVGLEEAVEFVLEHARPGTSRTEVEQRLGREPFICVVNHYMRERASN